MSENRKKLNHDAINAGIRATFEKIGRIVVYSEKLRYQLVDAIAVAEAGPELVDPEWSSLNKRLRAKFRDSSLTKIVTRLEQALMSRYSTDKESQAVVRAVCEQCRSLIANRNDVTHSLWSIGWRYRELHASSQSFRFDEAQMCLKDIHLDTQLEEIIIRFRIALCTVNGFYWATFRHEPLELATDPGPYFM